GSPTICKQVAFSHCCYPERAQRIEGSMYLFCHPEACSCAEGSLRICKQFAEQIGLPRFARDVGKNYFINSTTPILSNARKYCSTCSTGTGPYSAESALRISCTLRLPSAKLRH